MKNANFKPFMMFGGIIVLMFFFGLIFLGMMFFGGSDAGPGISPGSWWPGMWGMGPFMLIFPCLGLIVILSMAFFFFWMMAGGGGPMSGMMAQRLDPQPQNQVSSTKNQDACPSCESPIQAGWKVCPHCGQTLV